MKIRATANSSAKHSFPCPRFGEDEGFITRANLGGDVEFDAREHGHHKEVKCLHTGCNYVPSHEEVDEMFRIAQESVGEDIQGDYESYLEDR
jgi:hypothetical protein